MSLQLRIYLYTHTNTQRENKTTEYCEENCKLKTRIYDIYEFVYIDVTRLLLLRNITSISFPSSITIVVRETTEETRFFDYPQTHIHYITVFMCVCLLEVISLQHVPSVCSAPHISCAS